MWYVMSIGVATVEKSYRGRLEINTKVLYKAIGFKPHPKEQVFLDRTERFLVLICGRRWGKTLSAARWALPKILVPGTRGWVVSKTYDLTMKVLREIHADLAWRMKLKPSTYQRSSPIRMEMPWGSVIEGKSAEIPDRLMGEGLDWLVFDECAACKSRVWDFYLRPTLTDRDGTALFITTPKGYNWVYDLYKRGMDDDHPEWWSLCSPSWDNPHISPEDIEEARLTLTEAAFAQEFGAEFTTYACMVYKEFDRDVHIIPAREMNIHPDWPRYRSIDFGYENPFVCLYIAVDPADRIYVYKEYVKRHVTVEQHAKHLNQDTTKYEYTICDPSGASARATLLENGIITLALGTRIQDGLEAVRKQLAIRSDGKPGLFVSSACTETLLEFNMYSYPENALGLGADVPKKEYDHCMDALRYFVANWRKGYAKQYTGIYR